MSLQLVVPQVDELAQRIERAYRRSRPEGRRAVEPVTVWSVAAERLIAWHRADPALPIDPELFVAAQLVGEASNPWTDLTRSVSGRRYRALVRRLVQRLRRELRAELKRAEARIARQGSLDEVVLGSDIQLSPLAAYILALRSDRDDLAEILREAAREQHRACPLYRLACEPSLVKASDYPRPEVVPGLPARPRIGHPLRQFSPN